MACKRFSLEQTLCGWQRGIFSDDSYKFLNWTGKLASHNAYKSEIKKSFKNSVIYATYLCKWLNKNY